MDIKRNSHYIWRIFFTIFVSLGHSGWMRTDITSSYIGVDYFFIISGFFLADAVMKREELTWEYTRRRIIKLWPHVLFSFIIIFLFNHGASLAGNGKRLLLHFFEIIPGMYYVQDYSLVNEYMLNFPTWYLSCLILIGGGYITYISDIAKPLLRLPL